MKNNNPTWLLAVSGGPDSMALFGMLVKAGVLFACAHVNYHVRRQAQAEERYIKKICRDAGIVCYVKNDPFAYKGNFEAAARTSRYDFFAKICKEHGYAGLLTGHQQDDLLETMIMQVEKGVTPDWYGLKEKSVYQGMTVVRPLLQFTKQELTAYCRAHNIAYFIDATNLSGENTRGRIRRRVIGHLTAGQRQEMLAATALLNRRLAEVREKAGEMFVDEQVRLSVYRKADRDVRLAALRRLVKSVGAKQPTGRFLAEADRIIMRQADFLIPLKENRIAQAYGRMFVAENPVPYAYVIEEPEEMTSPYFTLDREGASTQRLHVGAEDFPLTVRGFRNGDRIAMPYGHKKVSRFFIDRRVPRCLRANWPIVENRRGEIILVPLLGCAKDHYCLPADYCVVQYPRIVKGETEDVGSEGY